MTSLPANDMVWPAHMLVTNMYTKEQDFYYSEYAPLADGLLNTFFQRHDLYARQLPDGRYICIRQPLTPNLVSAHLQGKLTLGTYVLDSLDQACFVVLDGDDDPQFKALISLHRELGTSVPTYLETSRRGGHLWLFFSEPVPGEKARAFGLSLAHRAGLPVIEVFPKQNRLDGGPGSLIRLPFGFHQRTGKRYGFVDGSLSPIAPTVSEQIRILTKHQSINPSLIPDFITPPKSVEITPSLIQPTPENLPLSVRIKQSISVRDFVGFYVELSPAGLGLCPFHDDKVNSFAVNSDGNYWNCFAGCGGGSIIDFWMRYRKCDFTTAVKELAKLLLKPD